MSIPGQTDIERIRYWQGQRLRGRDFRDQVSFEAELRWWHDRAIHNSFGVSYGFEVAPVLAGDSLVAVEVGCGVAYDCFGRELILQSSRRIPLPDNLSPTTDRLTLLARYREASQFPDKKHISVNWAAAIEQPAFLLKRTSEVELADGVPLARLTYESTASLESLPEDVKFPDALAGRIGYDGKAQRLIFKSRMTGEERKQLLELSSEDSYKKAVEELFQQSQNSPALDESFSAPRARALARPRIANGRTVPGHTSWELWQERVSNGRSIGNKPLGMQVTIDTSAAGFTEKPRYFAWLEGTGSLWNQSYIELFPAPLSHIDEASVTTKQFRFRLWMPNIIAIIGSRVRVANQNFATEFLNFAQSKKLHVCWLGIQCAKGNASDEAQECQCHTVSED